MGYIIALLLLVASFHLSFSDDFCPPSNVISPCTCDGEGINCMKVKTDSDLQRVFRSIPKPWAFRGVWIQMTDMSIIPSGMFRGIQVQSFHIEINRIRTVQSGAFSGSEESCASISIFGNECSDYPFADLKNFPYFQTFNAGRNKLTSIPDSAFAGHQYLHTIILPENMISYIGPNAFARLPSLMRLDLMHNRLTTLGPYALAMYSHLPTLSVNLVNCSIANIAPTAFNGMTPLQLSLSLNRLQYLDSSVFVQLVQRMVNAGGGQIWVDGNPLTCIGCTYEWIVVNKQVLQNMLLGFRCTDLRSLLQLDMRNIKCPSLW